ncbi:probable RNA-binding protein 19 isoform X2 [Nematostella vectensis]|uniref:probable RNA-binding protein 19 isoform X2 n=1 Tax=Nematostella vectensis TaxID=45351 RepID=UPI00207747FD|nr:probable RNA-binding protein 19 isoform X2 [Nematostella vectensis]
MSRLIVKNLPQNIKEDYFRSIFGAKGEITDIKLCRTKDGKFRRFGFVGYKTEKQAENALKYFNNSFIDTSKIQVDLARNLGDKDAPRPWSKYSEHSSAYQKKVKKLLEKNEDKVGAKDDKVMKKKKSKEKVKGLEELDEDPEFQEFVSAHESRSKKSLWSNDTLISKQRNSNEKETEVSPKKMAVKFEDSDESDDDVPMADKLTEDMEQNTDDNSNTVAKDSSISDMDYLRTKVTSSKTESDTDVNKEFDSDDDREETIDASKNPDGSSDVDEPQETPQPDKPKPTTPWTCKMRGLPFKAKEKHILEFFSPLKPVAIRFVMNKKGQPSGCAFVDFSSKSDLEKALKRNKDYLQGRYIELFKDTNRDFDNNKQGDGEKSWMRKLQEKGDDEEEEPIGESGRLFLRNLAYSCSEEDIQHLFEKFGPLSEVNLPLDKHTNKTIGIGFVTFLMPEHAVKAFNELDGTVFQGRLLHILPAKAKKEESNDNEESISYKKKNEEKKKKQSGSDHNWNTLFLGLNAVADVMADKYNTSKRDILDAESSHSLAVRMALGETQLVAETRKFLTEQGVKLDVFGQAAASRSKTVIVAKNLPYGTNAEELRTLFSAFGQLGRVILPPSGITALIEIPEPSLARKAFQKLAYSKFKNSPLYLEWAPLDVFVEGQLKKDSLEKTDKDADQSEEQNAGSDEEDTEGVTLFVKNLSFESTEEALKQKFAAVGPVKSATIAKKKDPKKPGSLLSMGYGFVEFCNKASAQEALKSLQHSQLDGHALELKQSHRKSGKEESKRKKSAKQKQKSSKILVRNVPFEATTKEIRELFSTFGEIKTLRLPKKMTGTGPHRGFAFVDFLTKQDAKRAFEALCTSTHLYGRRLVLEWAEDEDDVDTLRKRTADHFHGEQKKTKKKSIQDSLMDAMSIDE